MKIGNISQTVLKRSVLKQLKAKREESLLSPSVEEMCAGILVGAEDATLVSSATVYGDEKDLGDYGIAKAVNDVVSRNGNPIGVELSIQLPPYAYESRLKSMVSHMEACCERNHLQILGIKVTVCPVVNSAVIHATAIGSVSRERVLQTNMAKPDMDIVLLGSVGTEGALRILNKKKEEIEQRFIPSFFGGLLKYKERLLPIQEMKLAIEEGAVALHQLGDGGILAALWELGEAGNLGIEVDLKKMSIRQDVIEICEFVGVNPYQLSSTGSVLIITDAGDELVEKLHKIDGNATVIGRTTAQKERIILNGGEKRFLDRPTPGELMKLYEETGEI